jgi:hypothetical protein
MLDAVALSIALSHGADMVSTEIALSRPGTKEGNVLMADRGVRYAANALYGYGEWRAIRACRGGKKCKILVTSGLVLAHGVLAYHNLKVRPK